MTKNFRKAALPQVLKLHELEDNLSRKMRAVKLWVDHVVDKDKNQQ